MKAIPRGNLRLGSNVVEMLLPHRRPFLMVDAIEAFHAEPVPTLEAVRHITANEGIFEGHFDGIHVWPAAYTIEGLGQAAVLLIAILGLRRAASAEGHAPDTALEGLRNLDLGFRLQPGHRHGEVADLMRRIRAMRTGLPVGTSVEMKFQRPVFAGQRLDYRVQLAGEHPSGIRVDAEASVDGSTVASGVMMGAFVKLPALEP